MPEGKVRDRRRWYDPFVIGVGLVCVLCVIVTILVASTALETKDTVNDSVCAQVRNLTIARERERRLARTDDPPTRPAHRASVRAYGGVIADLKPLADCPDKG